MVETITPVVHGGRKRWAAALALHTAGATLAAALFGSLLGLAGAVLGAPWGAAGLAAVALAAFGYAISDLAGRGLPVPQLRRQVPDWWRTFFGWRSASFLYGAGLGVGFLTYLAHGTLVVVSVAAIASGRPMAGAVILAGFGLGRGFSVVTARNVSSQQEGQELVEELAASSERRRVVANAAVLFAVSALAGIGALRSARGEWAILSAAIVVGTFAWASVSKLVSQRGWRRSLAGYRLSPRLERAATGAVPAFEAAVVLLVVLGFLRAGTALAVLLLTGFSLVLVRAWVLSGPQITCGCFGGRRSRDVRLLLARNGVLLMLALAALGAPARQPVVWPGLPQASEILPAALAGAGLLVAVLTAWRSTSWLAKGRRA
jgi:hypothetical protein